MSVTAEARAAIEHRNKVEILYDRLDSIIKQSYPYGPKNLPLSARLQEEQPVVASIPDEGLAVTVSRDHEAPGSIIHIRVYGEADQHNAATSFSIAKQGEHNPAYIKNVTKYQKFFDDLKSKNINFSKKQKKR